MRIHESLCSSGGHSNLRGLGPGAAGKLWIVLFILAFLPLLSWAETPSSEDVSDIIISGTPTVIDFLDYAYRTNPKIRAAKESWQAVIEKYRLQTAFPDPQLSVTYYPEPIETRLGPQDWNANLSLKIPFPGKLSKTGEVVETEAKIARLNLDMAVRDVHVAIRESLHELTYIERAKAVALENSRLLAHFRKAAESAYADDRATLTDVVKAQSQMGQLRYDVLLLEDLEMTEKTRINALLSRPPDAAVGKVAMGNPPPVAFEIEEIYRVAEENQEEIRILAMGVAKAETSIELADYQNLPDFKLGLFYAAIGRPDVSVQPDRAGDDAIGVQFGLTIPLWIGKNQGRVGKARAEKRRAEALRAARVDDTRAQIRTLFFRVENAARIMTLYREQLLPEAARSMAIAESWSQEGAASFSDFLEAQAVWYNFQLAEARARADYGKYLARLERLVGRSLTEKPIPSPAPEERTSQ